MSSFFRFLSVCGARQPLRLTKQACVLPTAAHTALALDSATGGGQARGPPFRRSGKPPLCKGRWAKSLILLGGVVRIVTIPQSPHCGDWGIVRYRNITIPPSRLTPCHLPLHKGGFGAVEALGWWRIGGFAVLVRGRLGGFEILVRGRLGGVRGSHRRRLGAGVKSTAPRPGYRGHSSTRPFS